MPDVIWGKAGHPARLAIYFDAWLEGGAYQDAILKMLGLAPSSAVLDRVTDYGGGSSFDGLKFESDPKKMQLRERAKLLNPIEKALLDEIYQDEELVDLRAQIEAANPMERLTLS